MSYTPPDGDNVQLDFGIAYTPPTSDNVHLGFGESSTDRYVSAAFTLKTKLNANLTQIAPHVVSAHLVQPAFKLVASIDQIAPITITSALKQPSFRLSVDSSAQISIPVSASFTLKTELSASVGVVAAQAITASFTLKTNLNASILAGETPDCEINVGFVFKTKLSVGTTYSSGALAPKLFSQSGIGYQTARATLQNQAVIWHDGDRFRPTKNQPFQEAMAAIGNSTANYQQSNRLEANGSDGWQVANQLSQSANDQFIELNRERLLERDQWQICDLRNGSGKDKWRDLDRLRPVKTMLWGKADYRFKGWNFKFSLAEWINRVNNIIWQNAKHPDLGKSKSTVVIPPAPPPVYQGSTLLNFCCELGLVDPLNVQLNFGQDPCSTPKVVYIVNDVHLYRVSDNAEIKVLSGSVGIDKDSWCWSFEATIAAIDLPLVNPSSGAVEVMLLVNDTEWRFIVETYSVDRAFVKKGVKITGRSVTAYLDAPYSAVRSLTVTDNAYTSVQLAQAELERGGESPMFTLDWQLIDHLGWLIPANVYSYSNLTPIAAIKQIVNGVGGYISSDPSARTLHIKPTYAFTAWTINSQTPDADIDYNLVTKESFNWTEKPAYNGVYVSGENVGVTALVKVIGTAGDNQAPMVTDAMITVDAAARQRGIAELSMGGRSANVSVNVPFGSVGLYPLGSLLQFIAPVGYDLETWRGILRGISISFDEVKVNQTLTIERRFT